MSILPRKLVSGEVKSDNIERIEGPFPVRNFLFVYSSDFYPVRKGKLFYKIINKKKTELFVDEMGVLIIPYKPNEFTFYGRYKNAKGSLLREAYLKPYKIVLTKKMKSKDTIIRYFAQYKLDKYDTIFEINKQNFNRESNFYKKIRLVWQLKGPKENILMKNEEALEVAENSMYGIQNFLDPLEFYEEDVTLEEKLQKKLSRLKFVPDSTDTSSDPPSGWSAGDGPPPGSGY